MTASRKLKPLRACGRGLLRGPLVSFFVHLRSGITEKAMTGVADSLKLDAVGRGARAGNQYIQ
jgi:hypothetical protein